MYRRTTYIETSMRHIDLQVRVSNASVPVQYMARSDEWIVTALESVSTDIDIRFLSEERPDRWRVQHVNWGKGAVRMRVSLRRTSGFYVYNLLVLSLIRPHFRVCSMSAQFTST